MAKRFPSESRLGTKVTLGGGFLALALATLYAHASPASGYELSVYSGTPVAVWLGLSAGFVVSLVVAFLTPGDSRGVRALALGLGGLVVAVFVALPIVRGYHYYGTHDALTHLGWTRAVSEGTMSPFELAYPGLHTTAVVINAVTGVPLQQSILLVVLLATLVFVVFVPLCVGVVVDDPFAVTIATFGAVLLLPITTLATHLSAHPMSQAVFFSALFVYLLTAYVLSGRDEATFTAVGAALAVASIGAVVYHPQLAAHLIVALLAICLLQYARRRGGTTASSEHRPLYGQTLFLLAAFVVWTEDRGFYAGSLEYFLGAALEYVLGEGDAGAEVAAGAGSLSAVGGGIGEIFLKLFFPHLVFVVLTVALILGVLSKVVSTDRENVRAVTTYFTAGLAALGALFGIYFVGAEAGMHFRVFGLMMVLTVVLGSIAFYLVTAGIQGRLRRPARATLAVCFGALVVLSVLAVFPSPYVYHASPHVTEAQTSGYESAFETYDEDLELMGLRNGPNRYHDAVNANEDRMRLFTGVPEDALEDPLAPQYEDDRYLVLTVADHEREVHAYHELRYSRAQLEGVADQPGVDRVHSNDGFDLYLIRGTAGADA